MDILSEKKFFCLKLEIAKIQVREKNEDSKKIWWARCDSNAGPHGYQPCAPPS